MEFSIRHGSEYICAKPRTLKTTLESFDEIMAACRELFLKKTVDYGTSWRILRPASMTDQLYIKAKRIRSIEEKQQQKVEDRVEDDYFGLINYSIMALIQLELPEDAPIELPPEDAVVRYDAKVALTRELLEAKNHDYGEAWRDMRIASMTDMILQKLLRVRQIEDNAGKTLVSEGLDANYLDIINYAIFALIKLNEQNASS